MGTYVPQEGGLDPEALARARPRSRPIPQELREKAAAFVLNRLSP